MTHNKRDITEYWPVVDRPERQREAVNMQILLNLFKQIWVDQTPQYATPSFIRSFLQTYQISEIMSDIIHGDSLFLYPLTPSHRLPSVTSEELENLNGGSEQSLDLEELIDTDTVFDILIELESYQINAIDETLIMVLDEAFQEVQRKSEIQERCATQLEETQDAVQRAMLFLEMENEKEALAEFKKVSYSELLNPDNALDLISLIEKFQSKHSAFESLKRWFLLECVLHPITHDLISGLVSKRSKLKKSHRFIYLRKLLAKSSILTIENMVKQMNLCLPTNSFFEPDITEIKDRLYQSGYTLSKMEILFDSTESICFYTLFHDLSSQLNHFAELALKTRKRSAAMNAVERNIMLSMIGLFLPDRAEDIQFVIGYGSYNAFHEWIVDNLRTTYTIFKRIKPRNILDETDLIRIENQFKNICSLIERFIRLKGNNDYQLNFNRGDFKFGAN